jgi:demethylmenaquinone methyltransferase/2-methoxy-6-polyprenyl-1,4-benzoquinol methylase
MNGPVGHRSKVGRAYAARAGRYDAATRVFDLFRPFGFDIPEWRRQAVDALALQPGHTVVEVGCGTGLNLALLHPQVGPGGRIIGVDLSAPMLRLAQERALAQGWTNVELVCMDASHYRFPPGVDGILSTFALILVPDCDQVVARGCEALRPGGRFSVLDMAWPAGWSVHWHHLVFFLRSYGVTEETLRSRPWDAVQRTMRERLSDYARRRMFHGIFYLATGTAAGDDSEGA